MLPSSSQLSEHRVCLALSTGFGPFLVWRVDHQTVQTAVTDKRHTKKILQWRTPIMSPLRLWTRPVSSVPAKTGSRSDHDSPKAGK